MHGLIFRTVEAFVVDSFGVESWKNALSLAEVDVTTFEAMFQYDDAYLAQILYGCAEILKREQSVILEDIGTYLVTHKNHASVRRLMRFGGETFAELLYSLDELPGRTRLAVPQLELPQILVREHTPMHFTIYCKAGLTGFGHALVGLLRAMADDYGTLALLDHLGVKDGAEVIEVNIVETGFAKDRGFTLSSFSAAEVA